MSQLSQETDQWPPLLRIPNEMLLEIQSHLEDPSDLAQLASTCHHMWSRLGANDGIHIREARFWARRLRENQELHDLEKGREMQIQDEIENLLDADDPEGADALLEQHADHVYPEMRAACAELRARPPTLLQAITNGCAVPVVRRLLRLYRQLMPDDAVIAGRWGVSWRPGPCPTHEAARAGRVDVLRLLADEEAYYPGAEWRALVIPDALEGGQRLNRFEPLMSAVVGGQVAAARHLLGAGHSLVTQDHITMAAWLGDADMIQALVPAWAAQSEAHAERLPQLLRALVSIAAQQEADRRRLIDAVIALGAPLAEAFFDYADQPLPRAIRDRDGEGNLANVVHLMGRLAMHHVLSRASFERVVADAALAYPDHGFLRAAIPYAHLLAPEGTYDKSEAHLRGLEYLLHVELTQARPGADLALRPVGARLLFRAGLPRDTTKRFALGPALTGGEAVALLHGALLAPPGCPLDPPRDRRSPFGAFGPEAGDGLHPLRWICGLRRPRAAMCLIAHGARFPPPESNDWVHDAIWRIWGDVFNDLTPFYRAERHALIAQCQAGEFPIDLGVFDHPTPDPATFIRQVLTLYLLLFEPPTWAPHHFLVRGDFVARTSWPDRLFDLLFYFP